MPPIVTAAQQQASVAPTTSLASGVAQKANVQQNIGQQNQLNHSIASMTGHGGSKPTTSISNTPQNISNHSKNSATANITQTTALNFTKSALQQSCASGSSGNVNQQQNSMLNMGAQKAKRVAPSNTHQNTSNTNSVNSSSNSSNSMNNILANLASSPAMQQQLAMMMMNPMFMRQVGQMNPMITSALSNPVFLQQMMLQMMASQSQQSRMSSAQVAPNSTSNGNAAAMAALQQAAQQSTVQQQHKQSSSGGGGQSSLNINNAVAAAMASLTGGSSNENTLRQFQAYMAHLKTPGGVGGKKG